MICKTSDLEALSDPEIVIEGRSWRASDRPEAHEALDHVSGVTAVTVCNQPVYHGLICGLPEDIISPEEAALESTRPRQSLIDSPMPNSFACPFVLTNCKIRRADGMYPALCKGRRVRGCLPDHFSGIKHISCVRPSLSGTDRVTARTGLTPSQ